MRILAVVVLHAGVRSGRAFGPGGLVQMQRSSFAHAAPRVRESLVLGLGARALRSTEGERGDAREIGVLALPALISQLTDPFLSVRVLL